MLALRIDIPQAGKGVLVAIPGLGTFPNGTTTEVTEVSEAADDFFRLHNGALKHVVDADGEPTGQLRWKPGPGLVEAAESMYGVAVEPASRRPDPPDQTSLTNQPHQAGQVERPGRRTRQPRRSALLADARTGDRTPSAQDSAREDEADQRARDHQTQESRQSHEPDHESDLDREVSEDDGRDRGVWEHRDRP
jgi:hypothetical protein